MENFNQEDFNRFIVENNIYGFFEDPIILKSGRQSYFYANFRNVVEDVWMTDKLADFVIAFARDNGIEVNTFYGVPEGATKLGIIVQYKWAQKSDFYYQGSHALAMGRAKPKEHGNPKDKSFVGMPKGKVVVIEDVTTTGGSLLKTVDNLQEAGVEISAVISLTNRMEKRDDGTSVKDAIQEKGIKFYQMSSALEILPSMYKKIQPAKDVGLAIEEEFQKYGVEYLWLVPRETMADKLLDKIDEKQNPCVVGIDPFFERIPKYLIEGDSLEDVANAIRQFAFGIIDAVWDLVPAIKIQMAFFEKYGPAGVQAMKDTVDYARSKGLFVIEDAKRNDISSTAQAYADGHLGLAQTGSSKVPSFDVDMMTVNPYLGTDGLNPFVNVCRANGKGIFILAKTSNPSSGELQDRLVEMTLEEKEEMEKLGVGEQNETEVFNIIALTINRYAQRYKGVRGYSSIGAVVGATYPRQAEILRKIMPDSIILVPGYGAQGGGAQDLMNCFNDDGYGAVVNSSRGIIFAYEKYEDGDPEKFIEAAREATKIMIDDIKLAMKEAGKFPANWEESLSLE